MIDAKKEGSHERRAQETKQRKRSGHNPRNEAQRASKAKTKTTNVYNTRGKYTLKGLTLAAALLPT